MRQVSGVKGFELGYTPWWLGRVRELTARERAPVVSDQRGGAVRLWLATSALATDAVSFERRIAGGGGNRTLVVLVAGAFSVAGGHADPLVVPIARMGWLAAVGAKAEVPRRRSRSLGIRQGLRFHFATL